MDTSFPITTRQLLIPACILLLCILLSSFIPGHCEPKPNSFNSIAPKTIFKVSPYGNDSSTKFTPEYLSKESHAPKGYFPAQKQIVASDNNTLKIVIPIRAQFNSSDFSQNLVRKQFNDSDTIENHTNFPSQHDDSDFDGEHIPVRRHLYSSDMSDGQVPVRRQTDDDDDEQETKGDGANDDDSETNSEDTGSDGDGSDDDAGDDGTDDSDDGHTKKRGHDWPIQTWTEIMVLFRKDVRPENLRIKVGRKNVFRFISKALERSRQTELELLKLKELLKKLKNRLRDDDDGGEGGHDVNININAASPLDIRSETRDRKKATKGDFMRDVLHANYERSPFVAQESDPSFGLDTGMKSTDLEEEKLKFIKKGAEFLRNAWYQYRMRKRHQLMERSEDGHTHKAEESMRNKENDVLKSEKQEYITKGVAFLQNAWNQYKLRKYHHL